MANIKPFQAIRPVTCKAAQIAALPYDVYNREEAKKVVAENPQSFLKIDRAETQFEDSVDTYADCVYQKAHDTLWEMVENGEFKRDEAPAYYIYEMTKDGRSQTGIAACVSIDEYMDGAVKKHENTREEKEADRTRHIDACHAQTGPIFLAYRRQSRIDEIVNWEKELAPTYDFVTEDGIRHRLWVVDEGAKVANLNDAFAGTSKIYIADGHHRAASAVKIGLKRREAAGNYDGTEEFNYVMSVLFPDSDLNIMDYNRVVKDLNGNTPEQFLNLVKQIFEVTKICDAESPDRPACEEMKPQQKGEIAMFLGKEWYRLSIKEASKSDDPVEGLDVSILQNLLLDPVLGIEDPRNDKRIDFVGGIRGMAELERRVSEDAKVAFAMYPVAIEELFAVADAGLLLPPKSTWFEPKLRSGLFIHEIDG